MRRFKQWWDSIFNFGEAEYKGVRELQAKLTDELAHLEKLQNDVNRAHADLPEALSKMQGQIRSLAEKTRETEAMLAKLRTELPKERPLSPEELSARVDEALKQQKKKD